jgi:hypothetical protein
MEALIPVPADSEDKVFECTAEIATGHSEQAAQDA